MPRLIRAEEQNGQSYQDMEYPEDSVLRAEAEVARKLRESQPAQPNNSAAPSVGASDCLYVFGGAEEEDELAADEQGMIESEVMLRCCCCLLRLLLPVRSGRG